MFDFDSGLDSLELGSRRRPVKWAVELNLADCRPQKHKARKRQQSAQQGAEAQESRPPAHQQQQHAQIQQAAQQQRLAAHRKHLEELSQRQHQDPADVTPAQAKHRKEFRDSSVVCLSTEIEQGNVEYKYRLTGCITNENRRHQLVTQMKFRLSEGSGECFYYLGVEDDGYPRGLEHQELQDSIAVIHRMAVSLQATARLVEYVPGGFGRTAALMHIKANVEEDMRLTDSRVAVAGSMDSGKSTLVAVLTHGADGRPLLDNGRGSARMAVFRHKHEIESGRTSSISQQVLGYDDEGRVLNYVGVATPTPADITAAATHMVNFLDMGGHEKYLKTTLYGMTCLLPDYALLCVDAATGITRITREHLAVAVALEVPTALVVTKSDAVDDQQLQQVLDQLHQLMQPVLHNCIPEELQQGVRSSAPGGETSLSGVSETGLGGGSSSSGVPLVQCEQQATALAAGLTELHSCTAGPAAPSFQQAVFPVFVVSGVTGAGIHLLHAFLSHLKPLQEQHKQPSSSGGTGVASASSAKAAGGVVPVALSAQQQPQVSAGLKASSSSQLWGVSPKKQPPLLQLGVPAHAATPAATTSAGAHEPTSVVQEAAGAEVAGDGDECRPGHFQVVHTYDVEGVGWVVSGIAVTGMVEVGQSLLWGPTPDGGFSPVRVTCIQRSHIPVRQVAPGQTATLALQPTTAGLPHSGSRQALLTAAAVAQAAAAEAAAREAAAAIAAVPEPIAKTRRRSPAALKAAAAVAAHTAATAAAAADAARRAAETVEGRAWWSQEPEACVSTAAGAGRESPSAIPDSAAVADGLQGAGAAGCKAGEHGADADALASAAAGSVVDLLDDDFAAGLADIDSGSDSDAGLFGASPQLHRHHSGAARGSPVIAAAGAAAAAAPAVAGDAEDLFAGLAGVFADEDDADEQLSPGRDSSRSSSSSGSADRLTNSWSFSSVGSSVRRGSAASASSSRPVPAPRVASAPAVPGGGVRNLSMLSHSGSEQLLGCSPSRWRTKGSVLLDAAAAPHTYWEFEALLVLLGGFWPARGLLSGSWPPEADAAVADVADAAGSLDAAPATAPATAPASTARGNGAPEGAGSLPSEQEQTEVVQQQQQPGRQRAHSRGRKQRRSSKRFEFAYVVHCNSIRQTARVVSMQELRGHCSADEGGAEDNHAVSGSAQQPDTAQQQLQQEQQEELQRHCGLTASIRAAAALLQGASAVHSDREGSSGCASGDSSGDGGSRPRQRRLGSGTAAGSVAARRASDAGSVVAVRFRFTHRPEWMQVGARMIVRDRSDGHVAAAGFVTKLLEPHTQLQQQMQQHKGAGKA